jgi:hypothetical protein
MAVDAFRQKAFASALASACERSPAAFRFHSSAKAMLALASPLGWLIRAFHKTEV